MSDVAKEKKDELEIDLQQIFDAVLKKTWLISLIAVICAVVTLVFTFFFVTPMYQAAAIYLDIYRGKELCKKHGVSAV